MNYILKKQNSKDWFMKKWKSNTKNNKINGEKKKMQELNLCIKFMTVELVILEENVTNLYLAEV